MVEEWLSPAACSGQAGCTTGRIYQLIRENALPATRALGRIRVRRSDWEKFLAGHVQDAGTEHSAE